MTHYQKVTKIICEILGIFPERVTPDAKFEELGADDIDLVEIAMYCEEEFNIECEDDKIEGMKTIGELLTYLKGIIH